jgi:hypothetical protein
VKARDNLAGGRHVTYRILSLHILVDLLQWRDNAPLVHGTQRNVPSTNKCSSVWVKLGQICVQNHSLPMPALYFAHRLSSHSPTAPCALSMAEVSEKVPGHGIWSKKSRTIFTVRPFSIAISHNPPLFCFISLYSSQYKAFFITSHSLITDGARNLQPS